MAKDYISFEEIITFVNNVATKFKNHHLSGVYGIPRGGLIFAVMISHKMDIPLLLAPAKGCLIVDDISDTGVTLKHYSESGYLTATMFIHPNTIAMPTYYERIKKDNWIVYPWELND